LLCFAGKLIKSFNKRISAGRNPFLDFAFYWEIRNPKSKIEIQISQSNAPSMFYWRAYSWIFLAKSLSFVTLRAYALNKWILMTGFLTRGLKICCLHSIAKKKKAWVRKWNQEKMQWFRFTKKLSESYTFIYWLHFKSSKLARETNWFFILRFERRNIRQSVYKQKEIASSFQIFSHQKLKHTAKSRNWTRVILNGIRNSLHQWIRRHFNKKKLFIAYCEI